MKVSIEENVHCMCTSKVIVVEKDNIEVLEFCLTPSEDKWTVDVPNHLSHLKNEIEEEVNKNLYPGCCGGCR